MPTVEAGEATINESPPSPERRFLGAPGASDTTRPMPSSVCTGAPAPLEAHTPAPKRRRVRKAKTRHPSTSLRNRNSLKARLQKAGEHLKTFQVKPPSKQLPWPNSSSSSRGEGGFQVPPPPPPPPPPPREDDPTFARGPRVEGFGFTVCYADTQRSRFARSGLSMGRLAKMPSSRYLPQKSTPAR